MYLHTATWFGNDVSVNTLQATYTVWSVPSVKQTCTIMQIFNAGVGNNWVSLQFRNYELVASIYDETSGSTTRYTLSSVAIGEKFEHKVLVTNGTVTFYHNGRSALTLDVVPAESLYFKAGAYGQYAASEGDNDNSTIYIHSLEVQHYSSAALVPTALPTSQIPTAIPSAIPTYTPSAIPTTILASGATYTPTAVPTYTPTVIPTFTPTAVPTHTPFANPTAVPSAIPTYAPTAIPTATPSLIPTYTPSAIRTYTPSAIPTPIPTFILTHTPTAVPSTAFSTYIPSAIPSTIPTIIPTTTTTLSPTLAPTDTPSLTTQSHPPTNKGGNTPPGRPNKILTPYISKP